MTILFLTRLFYPHIGGVEKHVMEVGRRLVAKGHRVIVITENQKSPAGASLQLATKRSVADYKSAPAEIEGIEVYRIQVGNHNRFKKFRIWKSLWNLRNIIKSSDIMHCHDIFFWYLPFRFIYPFKKVYTTFHGYESFPIRKRVIFMHKIAEKLSNGNICIGDFISKWYGTKPDYVSYGAVSTAGASLQLATKCSEAGYKPSPAKVARNDKNHSAIFIGRLDDQTGILTYTKTFELIKKKFPDFEFLVVGDGPYRKEIAKKVKVIGFQKDPEKYFAQYHFAFVSRYLSILEAFAARKLVFAVYDNPIKEDYLKMSPFAKFIITESDPEQLAEKVIYYLNHPQKERALIDKAYKWVSAQTWKKMVEMYLSLWKI